MKKRNNFSITLVTGAFFYAFDSILARLTEVIVEPSVIVLRLKKLDAFFGSFMSSRPPIEPLEIVW